MLTIYSKNIVTETGVIEGYLQIEDGKITAITQQCDSEFINHEEDIILPGFIDQHTHGWGRGSFLYENNEKSLRMMIEDQVKEGVTSFLATTFTDTQEHIKQSIDAANIVYPNQNLGSKLLGLHIEGPFINKTYRGAQLEEFCIDPSVEIMQSFIEHCDDKQMIKLITLAPELPNAKQLIEYCKQSNIQVAAGHTGATFEELMESISWGVGGVTHMFSAMTGLHHRKPGVVGAALYSEDLICEFAKQTGITVRHEMFDMTYRLKGASKIILTTDCLGNGMQKEPYYHARRNVHFIPKGDTLEEHFEDGKVIVYDLNNYESLRHIELSFLGSVQNIMKHSNVSLSDLALMCATNSAKYIGVYEKTGSLTVGKCADITILNQDFQLQATIVDGQWLYKS